MTFRMNQTSVSFTSCKSINVHCISLGHMALPGVKGISFSFVSLQNEKFITIYDTRTGSKDKELAYKPASDDNAHQDFSNVSTVDGVCYLSNSDCIIVSVAITGKDYSSFYKLICFDLKTDEVVAKSPGSISQNSQMTLSKVSYRSFAFFCKQAPLR